MTADAVTSPTADDLAARLARLEAENDALRARLDDVVAPAAGERRERRGSVWRAIVSAICIVLATIVVPVSVVGGWARGQLVDEDTFVQTFAPLADDPRVQTLIIDQTTTAIEKRVDLAGITDDLFDGLQQLDLPPAAISALGLLRQPAANALTGLVDSAVTRLVQSDAFATVWAGALRASHRALVATATGGTANGAVDISDSGEVGIQLGPIVDAVKQRLVDSGMGFASAIPAVDATIVVAQADALVTIGVVYNIAVTVGWWLPFVALALFAVGIAVARSRRAALAGSGIGLAIGGGVLGVALASAGTVLALSAPSLGIPSATLSSIYQQIVGDMERTAWIVFLLGVIIAVLAWVQGRSRAARAVRSTVGSANVALRGTLAGRGLDTGGFGRWMYAQRVLVRVILSILLVVWLLALRPLSFGDVMLVLLVGLIVWWLAEIVQRRPGEAVRAAEVVVFAEETPEEVVVVAAQAPEEVVVVAEPAPEAVPAADEVAEPEAAPAADEVAEPEASSPSPAKPRTPRAPRKPKAPPAES